MPDQRTLKIVVEALARPQDFFGWALRESRSQERSHIIRAAQKYVPVATWPWDKACILAGALLATVSDIAITESASQREVTEDFPYWAALDKHTDEGKTALREVAKQIKTTYRQLIWVSFYCESAQVNRLVPSPWFEAERAWRLKRAGVLLESAEELWFRARPLVRERLEVEARSLKNLLWSPLPANVVPPQDSLL